MSRTSFTNAFALLACSLLLVASIGCNPGALTGPDTSPSVDDIQSPTFVRILSTSSKGVDGPVMVPATSAMISASEGGTLSNGRVSLEFPAGALDQDTEISMKMLADGTLGVQLSPHGIEFNLPVVLSMDLEGTTAEGLGDQVKTFYENEEVGVYEEMESAPSGDPDRVSALLEHFSKYRIGVDG